jgi:serine/threonine protein kinase
MTAEQRDLQRRLFTSLQAKLEAAVQRVSRIDQPGKLGRSKKLKLALVKDALEDTIAELESWQRLCEPAWFYWVKLASPAVDMALSDFVKTEGPTASGSKRLGEAARNFRRAFADPTEASQSVFIREDALDGYSTVAIPFYSTKVAINSRYPQHLIMDVVDLALKLPAQTKNVRDFARRLRQSEHSISGLLSCKGVVRHGDNRRLSFLFRVPEGYTNIQNLRQLLISGRSHDSLSDRLEMAKQLAKAVYYVHLYGFVHKSIRPETILSLGKAGEACVSSTISLVGFQVIRTADGRTYSMSDLRWENNLYRHPQRQGNEIDYFVMQHDIYSLGVCLLEIGLWEPFVVYGTNGIAQPSPALALTEDRSEFQDPPALKDHLVALSRSTRLRGKMGTKYSKVVETCLTCLDEDNVDFGDDQAFQDEDGVEVGARYIEKILGLLNAVSA